MLEIITLVLVATVLARVSYLSRLANVNVSLKEFLECLGRMEAPAVLITERRMLWLLGVARYDYACVYRGHRLRLRSPAKLSLPGSIDAIHVRKW
jgi:hypothetical protein